MTLTVSLVAVLLAATVLCGCGAGDPSAPTTGSSVSTSPTTPAGGSGSPSASDSPTEDLSLPSGSPRDEVMVLGVVTVDEELRCTTLTLDSGKGTYVLSGDVSGVRTGERVRVTGVPDPQAATTCQGGPVLVVREVRAEG